MSSEPPSKRPKKDEDTLIREAWICYRNYIDAEYSTDGEPPVQGEYEEDQDNGAVDELLELIDILEPLEVQPFVLPMTPETMKNINIKSLLPIFISVANLHLANYVAAYMFSESKDNKTREFLLGFDSPIEYFQAAKKYWPTNPAAVSLHANYDRMNCWRTADEICSRYVTAAEHGMKWRELVVKFLEDDAEVQSEVEGLNVKEWVEMLMANGSLGMECREDDDEKDEDTNGGGDNSEYSFSEIEATAAFMAALLLSSLDKHEEALEQLKKFNLSHRIHPNVWKMAHESRYERSKETYEKDNTILFEPKLYLVEGEVNASDTDEYYPEGVLPQNLYHRLCEVFAPRANYWRESKYNDRGYYSYFIDLDRKSGGKSVREQPTNVIEDVIVNHLLPLAETTLEEKNKPTDETEPDKIIGAEWWVHTRQLGANLGHQMHFDTDESLLGREKKVTHPIISSVLYLTGAKEGSSETSKAGATIVCNQTPDSKEVASKAWVSHPKDNSFMTFPGNLLHGVLPCTGPEKPKTPRERPRLEDYRLTFMVGFWTRNVAEGMGKHRKLYGPCGPLPLATEEHSWVMECQSGYETAKDTKDDVSTSKNATEITSHVLPCTSPAWEEFKSKTQPRSDKDPPPLMAPKGLDHRYFVLNAPHCFSQSLFDNEDTF